MKSCFRLDISVSSDSDVELLSGILALHAPYGWEEQDAADAGTRFCVYSEHAEYVLKVRDAVQESMSGVICRLTESEGQDWLSAWREYFTPVVCGTRFVVLPPWLTQHGDFSGRTPIIIEPKSAFGTGHHATTALCLRMLGDLLDSGRIQPGQKFLDLGTGSGVLAIACSVSGLAGLALDIDQLAVDNALENKLLNNAENFEVRNGGPERAAEYAAEGRYDVMLANILAGPLVEFAPAIAAILAPDGCLILSGILGNQADEVEAAYRAEGLFEASRVYDGEWVALVWS
ncbi:MAG: 50S ribosomal protein L11 methyltransferase [Desulfovibrio sp.]|jgi:ribosomal protein L11 methyltransferase|nr:50S ribosomal protein L11 methyltransferase [Desulfovibrio sp.]